MKPKIVHFRPQNLKVEEDPPFYMGLPALSNSFVLLTFDRMIILEEVMMHAMNLA